MLFFCKEKWLYLDIGVKAYSAGVLEERENISLQSQWVRNVWLPRYHFADFVDRKQGFRTPDRVQGWRLKMKKTASKYATILPYMQDFLLNLRDWPVSVSQNGGISICHHTQLSTDP